MKEAKFQRIRQLIQTDRANEAIKMIHRILSEEPENAEAFSLLTWAYSKINEKKKALEAIKEALRIESYNPDFKLQLGRVYMINGQYHLAHQTLDNMGFWAQNSAQGHELRSLIFLRQGKLEEALKWSESGLELNAEDVDLQNLRAHILALTGQKKKASEALDSTLKILPNHSFTHFNKGWVLLKENKYEEAVDFFKNALRLSPNHEASKIELKRALKMQNIWYRNIGYWAVKENPSRPYYILIFGLMKVAFMFGLVANEFRPFLFFLGLMFFIQYLNLIREPVMNAVLLKHPIGNLVISNEEIREIKIVTLLTFISVFFVGSGGLLSLILGGYFFQRILIFGIFLLFISTSQVNKKAREVWSKGNINDSNIAIFCIIVAGIIFSFPSIFSGIIGAVLFVFFALIGYRANT